MFWSFLRLDKDCHLRPNRTHLSESNSSFDCWLRMGWGGGRRRESQQRWLSISSLPSTVLNGCVQRALCSRQMTEFLIQIVSHNGTTVTDRFDGTRRLPIAGSAERVSAWTRPGRCRPTERPLCFVGISVRTVGPKLPQCAPRMSS